MSSHTESVEAHHRAIQQEYRRQAAGWGQGGVTDIMRWIAEQVDFQPSMDVLDLAAGTGIFARTVAKQVRSVVALDLTEEMLARGRERASEEGLTNVTFVQGPAETLPFNDGTFDVVVTRYSVHHFVDPLPIFREVRRVLRPGGVALLVDMVADEDPEIADRHNYLERIADTTHTHILAPSQFVATLAHAGLRLAKYFALDVVLEFDDWQSYLTPDSAEKLEIRRVLEAELAGGARSGMRPFVENKELKFKHTWGIFVATNGIDALLSF
jgi:SAM-dependent methyltransferase